MIRHLSRSLPLIGRGNTLRLSRSFSSVSQPSLDVELPGIPTLSPASAHAKPTTKVSTLSNGLRVATEETYGQISTIGMFIDAGSRYETYENNGVSHMIEHMAFKSTESRSHLRMVREMEAIGATVGAASGRECIMYTGECIRSDTEKVVEIMADSILKPKLAPWDIDEQRAVIGYEWETLEENAQSLLTEMLHSAAFGENSPLGRSLWCPKRNIDKLGPDHLRGFMKNFFTPNNMVLAAAGVDHDSFVRLAEKYFTAPANYANFNAPKMEKEACAYTGGVKLVEGQSEFTHVALGFNPGSWFSEDLIDMCTLHFLLGGGGSFSAGGPGKGMYSRLYLNVLNQKYFVDSAIAFNSVYNDTGLFGIYGSCVASEAGNLLDIFSNELVSLTNGNLTDEEVARAKNQLKSSMVMKLESRQVLFEDIGRQILTYKKRETPEQLCKKVDAVSKDSLKKAAQKLLSSKPTIAAFGDLSGAKSLDKLQKRFG